MTRSLFNRPAVALLAAGLAFLLYLATLAPGLTWANFGADGGDLLAAAVVNGVPHPTGYPLYTLLLQGWLALLGALLPTSDIAWRGNLLSAVCAAAAVAVTADLVTSGHRLVGTGLAPAHRTLITGRRQQGKRREKQPLTSRFSPLTALLVALAWAASPLLWQQAIITEVYALHSLLAASLGRLLLVRRDRITERRIFAIGLVLGLGMAHHMTILLLAPALLYLLLPDLRGRQVRSWLLLAGGTLPGLLLYLRIPLVVLLTPLPPVNWGTPQTAETLWWLVGGTAYRHYLFAIAPEHLLAKLNLWALVLSRQFTPLGLGVALVGLYALNQRQPRLRNFVLLWALPVSLYSISYNTPDSMIYLLPVVWILALLLPAGLLFLFTWLADGAISHPLVGRIDLPAFWHRQSVRFIVAPFDSARRPHIVRAERAAEPRNTEPRPTAARNTESRNTTCAHRAKPEVAIERLLLVALALWLGASLYRLPAVSLRADDEAIRFVHGVAAVLKSGSIVFSSADAETFGLWYGVWASGEIAAAAPDLILVNVALYQFEWYRDLLLRLYPDLPGAGTPQVADILLANRGQRPIFFTEQIEPAQPEELEAVGPIWQWKGRADTARNPILGQNRVPGHNSISRLLNLQESLCCAPLWGATRQDTSCVFLSILTS